VTSVFKIRKKIANFTKFLKFVNIRVGTFLVTTSFQIYFEATTVEWEEWAVDGSCSDSLAEEHNDIPNDP